MKRRDVLRWILAGVAVRAAGHPLLALAQPESPMDVHSSPEPMPAVFLAHGAPPLLDDVEWTAQLARWAASMPKPRAVLMISAHWAALPAAIGATTPVPLVYDFYNFPQRFYELRYPAPAAPELASRVESALDSAGIAYMHLPDRGLDHGAFVPLLCMYPKADVPVLQVSLPGLDPKTVFDFGRALAPLRDEGVLIVGSGFLTHNLREGFSSGGTPGWARDFDAWAKDRIDARDFDALIDFRAKAPEAARNHPTIEHYVPVLVAAAASRAGDRIAYPIEGFWGPSSFTKRSVQFG